MKSAQKNPPQPKQQTSTYEKGDIVWISYKGTEHLARVRGHYPKERKISHNWMPLTVKSTSRKEVFKADTRRVRLFKPDDQLPANAGADLVYAHEQAIRMINGGVSEEQLIAEQESRDEEQTQKSPMKGNLPTTSVKTTRASVKKEQMPMLDELHNQPPQLQLALPSFRTLDSILSANANQEPYNYDYSNVERTITGIKQEAMDDSSAEQPPKLTPHRKKVYAPKKSTKIARAGPSAEDAARPSIAEEMEAKFETGEPILVGKQTNIYRYPGIFREYVLGQPERIRYTLFPRNKSSEEVLICPETSVSPLSLEQIEASIQSIRDDMGMGHNLLSNHLELVLVDAREYLLERKAAQAHRMQQPGSSKVAEEQQPSTSASMALVPVMKKNVEADEKKAAKANTKKWKGYAMVEVGPEAQKTPSQDMQAYSSALTIAESVKINARRRSSTYLIPKKQQPEKRQLKAAASSSSVAKRRKVVKEEPEPAVEETEQEEEMGLEQSQQQQQHNQEETEEEEEEHGRRKMVFKQEVEEEDLAEQQEEMLIIGRKKVKLEEGEGMVKRGGMEEEELEEEEEEQQEEEVRAEQEVVVAQGAEERAEEQRETEEEELPQLQVEAVDQPQQQRQASPSPAMQEGSSSSIAVSLPAIAPAPVPPKPPLSAPYQRIRVDAEGYLCCRRGDVVADRFEVMKELGEGVYAKVFKVRDWMEEKKRQKALKIVRNTRAYREAANHEIALLQRLDEADPAGREQLVVRMLEHMDFKGHICILFKLYGTSVFELMKENKYHPYPLDQIRYMAYQLIHAVKFMHDQGLIHTDLKPENILFLNSSDYDYVAKWHQPDPLWNPPESPPPRNGRVRQNKHRNMVKVLKDASIRLIDVGSAVFEHQPHEQIVSTRHYRAPEIILDLGWNASCDVWSLGCIFFELYTGHPMIPKVEDEKHLALIERILEPFPHAMKAETRTDSFEHGRLKCSQKTRDFAREHGKRLRHYIQREQDGQHQALFQLIGQMLSVDPAQRVGLDAAKQHAFFHELDPELRQRVDSGGGVAGEADGRVA